jgi:hypothetical protein
VGPRASPDDMKRKFLTLPGLELRPLGRPARSQSLYRQRSHGPLFGVGWFLTQLHKMHNHEVMYKNARRRCLGNFSADIVLEGDL